MSKGGGTAQNTVTQNNIPSELSPYITDELKQAQGLDQSGGLAKSYFPGNTVAPFSNASTTAQNLITQRATNGSPLQSAATASLTNIANGSQLNSNPYIDQAYNSAARSLSNQFQNITQPGIASQFNAAGRFGSGLYQNAQGQADQALGQSLGDLANNMYYQNYNDASGRQLLAATSAPQVAAADYNDANQLSAVGAQQENLSQQQINDQISRYYDNPQLNALAQYQALITGSQPNTYDKSQAVTNQPRTSALAGGLGGAASGAATGAMIGSIVPGIGTGFGALAGGALGGLGGIFG